MLGLMQDRPLLISSILEHAARHHADAKIVSARPDGSLVAIPGRRSPPAPPSSRMR